MDDKEFDCEVYFRFFLSSVIVNGSAVANDDFHALGRASGLMPMSEEQLAAVEGGQIAVGFEKAGPFEVFETKVGAFTDIAETIGGLLPALSGNNGPNN